MTRLFENGFEEGDTSAWTATTNTPTVSGGNALIGSYGMGCDISGADQSVHYAIASNQSKVRIRMYVGFASLSLTPAAGTRLLILRNDAWGYEAVIELWDTEEITFRGITEDDDTGLNMTPVAIDHVRFVEIELAYSTGVGANNGYAKWWINGQLQEVITGIDNDLGHVRYVDIGSRDAWGTRSGTVKIDQVAIDNVHYIGRDGHNPLPGFIKQSH